MDLVGFLRILVNFLGNKTESKFSTRSQDKKLFKFIKLSKPFKLCRTCAILSSTGSTRSSGADFIAFIEQQANRIGKNFNHSILAPHIDYCLGLVLFSLVTFLPG